MGVVPTGWRGLGDHRGRPTRQGRPQFSHPRLDIEESKRDDSKAHAAAESNRPGRLIGYARVSPTSQDLEVLLQPLPGGEMDVGDVEVNEAMGCAPAEEEARCRAS